MSHYLLDTHTFIWLAEISPRLPEDLRDLIDTADLVYLSIASLWEIAIKVETRKLKLKEDYETIGVKVEDSDILMLPISFEDTLQISRLPSHHRDPFDRMIIAQAINHSLDIISIDSKFDAYDVQRVWA